MVKVGACGPCAPSEERVANSSFSRVAGAAPRGSLLRSGGEGTNHGTRNGVAMERHNNKTGGGCEVVSFGEGGSKVPTAIIKVRCSPGEDTGVTLVYCTSNRGTCVLTPRKLASNVAIVGNTSTRIEMKGYLPLSRVPINARVRGVRLCPKGNKRLIHSTNGDTRLVTGRKGCTALELPSKRVEVIPVVYHTSVNIMKGNSRGLVGINGTKHGHRVKVEPAIHNSMVGPGSRPRKNKRNGADVKHPKPYAP